MRILFCTPPATFSVSDMARGYMSALRRQGHEVIEYSMLTRMDYHRRALDATGSEAAAWKHASETILTEAIYCAADLVVLVCGLSFHPVCLQLLSWGGFKTVVLHTESPYQDDEQVAWNVHHPGLLVCTHEQVSAERYGWTFLPHAFDPDIHQPVAPDPALACDVVFIGTGWKERIALFEAVDWTGIDVRFHGVWGRLSEDSPLRPYYREGYILNEEAPRYYASAKIALNLHRQDADAQSLNPRAYELAACGAFQITDPRGDRSLFARSLPTFRSAPELEALVRHSLAHPDVRQAQAETARSLVQTETFDARATALMAAVSPPFKGAEYRMEALCAF